MQKTGHEDIPGRIREENLCCPFAFLRKKTLGNLKNTFVLVVIVDLIENVPVIAASIWPDRCLVITDHYISGAEKLLIKVTLGIKNDHNVIICE